MHTEKVQNVSWQNSNNFFYLYKLLLCDPYVAHWESTYQHAEFHPFVCSSSLVTARRLKATVRTPLIKIPGGSRLEQSSLETEGNVWSSDYNYILVKQGVVGHSRKKLKLSMLWRRNYVDWNSSIIWAQLSFLRFHPSRRRAHQSFPNFGTHWASYLTTCISSLAWIRAKIRRLHRIPSEKKLITKN